jgi:rSAM/selenodomain-associated transferase 1
MSPIRIVIFAKAPLAGLAKTRLIPALGEEGSARLAQRMLNHTVAEALAADIGEVELCVTPEPNAQQWRSFRDPEWPVSWQGQGDGDLGERLTRATRRGVLDGRAVLLIGTDCPFLTADRLRDAAARLESNDAVINPSADGGYVLLGLKTFNPSVFRGIAWSTDSVAFETLCQIGALGWTVAQLPMLRDIDEPADLVALPPGWLAS